MTGRHDTHRARQVCAEIREAACRGRGLWWSEQEAAHKAADTKEEARTTARPALEVCAGCPESQLCHLRAELDSYTGLAAGALYVNGRRRTPDTVLRPVTPPHELPSAELPSAG